MKCHKHKLQHADTSHATLQGQLNLPLHATAAATYALTPCMVQCLSADNHNPTSTHSQVHTPNPSQRVKAANRHRSSPCMYAYTVFNAKHTLWFIPERFLPLNLHHPLGWVSVPVELHKEATPMIKWHSSSHSLAVQNPHCRSITPMTRQTSPPLL